jgi:hypothetical protein
MTGREYSFLLIGMTIGGAVCIGSGYLTLWILGWGAQP